MAARIGVLRSDGTPSYGVNLKITPNDWRSYFKKAGLESHFISPKDFEHLDELFRYHVIANPYGAVIPEYKDHAVTSGLKAFIEEGGILLEVMPPPFYLCHFKEDGTLVSMIDMLAEQYSQILTKSDGFDRTLKLTKVGEKILSPEQMPDSVFKANKGAFLSTLFNYSSRPGLSLIVTDKKEPILDILTVGKGRIVRWGCNLEPPFKSFIFNSFKRIIEYLFEELSFKETKQSHKKVVISVSPVNYWVGDSSRQQINISVLNGEKRPINNLKMVVKPEKAKQPLYQKNLNVDLKENSITLKTAFNSKDDQDWSIQIFKDEKKCGKKIFKPSFAARHTVFSNKELKDAIPQTRKPEGFDDFWRQTLEEASEIEKDIIQKLDKKRSNGRILLYRIYFRSLEGDRIHGWFCRRNDSERGPAILILPGYSDASKFIPLNLIEEGFSILALDPRGHGESVKKIYRNFPGFITMNIMDRFQYPYRGVYIDCLRAIEYLLSNPQVEEKKVGVMGISQGGGLALLTAALKEKVAFVIADSPFLSDMNRGIEMARDGPYVELAEYLNQNPSCRDVVLKNLSFFDVVNFVERVRSPTLISVGLMDTICPPITAYSTYNKLQCTKRLDVYPKMGHFCGVYGDQERRFEWIKNNLKRESH